MTRYLSVLIITALGLCGSIAAFNYVVDPYAIYHFEKADEEYLSRTRSVLVYANHQTLACPSTSANCGNRGHIEVREYSPREFHPGKISGVITSQYQA